MTGTPRAERLAENEGLFRMANERTVAWEERHGDSLAEPYFCECADLECRQTVSLTKAEYERVRSDACHFLIVLGHEVPDIETVIEENDSWAVVEKTPEVSETVKRMDPRHAS